jgi:hypothetical protein
MDEEANHIEASSARAGCEGFIIPPNMRRALLVDVVRAHGPDGTRRRGIDRVMASSKDFSADDMLQSIRQEEYLLEVSAVQNRSEIRRGV